LSRERERPKLEYPGWHCCGVAQLSSAEKEEKEEVVDEEAAVPAVFTTANHSVEYQMRAFAYTHIQSHV
jgi:hypothetical protein